MKLFKFLFRLTGILILPFSFLLAQLSRLKFYLPIMAAVVWCTGLALQQTFFGILFYRYEKESAQRAIFSFKALVKKFLGEARQKYNPVFEKYSKQMCSKQPYLWELQGADGKTLHALFYFNPKAPKKRLAILAHGYRGHPIGLSHLLHLYYDLLGFHVLCPIARGHGSSEGYCISLGWLEKQDYPLWVEEALKELGNDTQIVLHGFSMGAATVLMVGAKKIPAIKAIISEGSFDSLPIHFIDHANQFLPARASHWLLERLNQLLANEAKFRLEDVDVRRYVPEIEVPLLIIHSDSDKIFPVSSAYKIYKACKSPEKRFFLVEGEAHSYYWFSNPEKFNAVVKNFLKGKI